jgi:phosphoglycolate phosphatase-like HAD superfamily hydrolase
VNVIIFDIDGTIADCTHRLHYIKDGKKDWDSFFGTVSADTVIEDMQKLYNQLHVLNHIIICTGRSDVCREATEQWLHDHGFRYVKLYMRKAGDRRADYLAKEDMLKQILSDGYKPTMVFDDRTQVVEMWRRNGIRCLQVAKGDF